MARQRQQSGQVLVLVAVALQRGDGVHGHN